MISSKSGDKRAGGIFRKNKISPSPVFYALVHPKPASVNSKSSSPQQKQADAISPLLSPQGSPMIPTASLVGSYTGSLGSPSLNSPSRGTPDCYIEARGEPSSDGDGRSSAGAMSSPGFRRKKHAAALSPILINVDEEMPTSFSSRSRQHADFQVTAGYEAQQRPSNDGSVDSVGSVGAMATAVATAALDVADALPSGEESGSSGWVPMILTDILSLLLLVQVLLTEYPLLSPVRCLSSLLYLLQQDLSSKGSSVQGIS